MRASFAALRGSSAPVTTAVRAPVPPFRGGRTQGVRTPHVRAGCDSQDSHRSSERIVLSDEVSGAPGEVATPTRWRRGVNHRTPAGDTNTAPRRQTAPSVTARSLQARQAIAAKHRVQNLDFAVILSSAYRRIGAAARPKSTAPHRRKPSCRHQKAKAEIRRARRGCRRAQTAIASAQTGLQRP